MWPFSGSRRISNGLLGWALLSTTFAARGQDLEGHLQEGARRLAAGQFDQALQSWCQARRLQPGDPRSYIHTARALLAADREHDAVIELQDVLKLPLGPTHAVAVARLLEQSGLRTRAIELLETHRHDSALPAEALWLLSDLHFQAQKADLSLAVLEDFSRRQPDDPRIEMRRGRLLLQTGRLEQALTCFENVVAAQPRLAEGYFQMATTLRLGNNPEAAERMALRAVELAPRTAGYRHLLALVRRSLNKQDAALSDLIEASRTPDVFPRVYFDLGNLYRDLGEAQKSREALLLYRDLQDEEEAEKNRRQKIVQLVNQGETSLHAGDIEGAIDAFRRALASDPVEWDSSLFLAKIYLSSPQPELASPHVQKLLEIDPKSSEATYLAAYFEQQRGNTRQALRMAERSRRLRPTYPEVRNLTGNLYLALNRPDEALEEYLAAFQLAPEVLAFRANYESLARRLSARPGQRVRPPE